MEINSLLVLPSSGHWWNYIHCASILASLYQLYNVAAGVNSELLEIIVIDR